MTDALALPAVEDLLPALLRELHAAHGLGPVLRLLHWRGGRTLYIPQQVTAEHELVKRVGWKAATWLVEFAPGEPLTIPKGQAYHRALRDYDIWDRHNGGVPVARLAAEHDLHERQVWRVLASFRGCEDQRQASLL